MGTQATCLLRCQSKLCTVFGSSRLLVGIVIVWLWQWRERCRGIFSWLFFYFLCAIDHRISEISLVDDFHQNLFMSTASSVIYIYFGYCVHCLLNVFSVLSCFLTFSLWLLYIKLGAQPEWSTWSGGHRRFSSASEDSSLWGLCRYIFLMA